MLIFALAVNIAILLPLVAIMSRGSMVEVFGPVSDARLILTCIYGAIVTLSAGLIALHAAAHPWALPMTLALALFAVQIIYKLATVPVAGIASPVVITNLAVVALQLTIIAALYWRGGLMPPG